MITLSEKNVDQGESTYSWWTIGHPFKLLVHITFLKKLTTWVQKQNHVDPVIVWEEFFFTSILLHPLIYLLKTL